MSDCPTHGRYKGHRPINYRGYLIHDAFEGWKVQEPNGAWWPEKYRTISDAQRIIDKELR